MSGEQILKEAMALPAEEKAKLAEKLLSSLTGPEQQAIDAEWAEELEARIDAYERGEETARPADEAIAEIRQRLLGHRR